MLWGSFSKTPKSSMDEEAETHLHAPSSAGCKVSYYDYALIL